MEALFWHWKKQTNIFSHSQVNTNSNLVAWNLFKLFYPFGVFLFLFVFRFFNFFFAFQNFEILTQNFQMQRKLLATKKFVLWVEKNDLKKFSNKKIHSTFNNRKMWLEHV